MSTPTEDQLFNKACEVLMSAMSGGLRTYEAAVFVMSQRLRCMEAEEVANTARDVARITTPDATL